jgi:CDGSH-type Zn-finger protein
MRERPHEVVLTDDGPMLVSGPVEVVLPDGQRVRSDRPVSALCMCRRSRSQPFRDTSHRRKVRPDAPEQQEEDRAQPQRTTSR